MLYTVNYTEVSQPEFTRALRAALIDNSIIEEYYTEDESFSITEYEDGTSLEVTSTSKELITN